MPVTPPTLLITEPDEGELLSAKNDLQFLNPTADRINESFTLLKNDMFLDKPTPGLRTEQEADILARRLFLDDKDLFSKEEAAQFLGKRGELNMLTLEKYLDHFDFSKMRLEDGFRRFCSKLFLKGESQTIDRILNQFARRYWECNRDGAFPNQDTVYTIVYSLLLLNTDLHGSHITRKMSKQDFIKNTLASVQTCAPDEDHPSLSGEELTTLLKEMYSSVKHNQIPQPFEGKSRRRSCSESGIGLTRSQSAHTLRKVRSKLTTKPSTSSFFRYDSRSAFYTEGKNPRSIHRLPFGSAIASLGEEAGGYSKSGILARKHLNERTGKKAQHRQWKNCFVALDRGDLKMFKAGKGHHGGDGSELMDLTMQLGHISLRHSLTIALPPPGYSKCRPHVFAVQLPNGGVFLFQTESHEQVQEWVNTCNYWAARESKEPMPGAVCNIDYGWKNHFEPKSKLAVEIRLPAGYDDHTYIKEWSQPNNPMLRSNLSENAQLKSLIQYNDFLDKELANHMELRSVIFERFSPKSSNMSRAFSNWERKSQYLLRELIKYQTYADSLKQALPDFDHDLSFNDSPKMEAFSESPLQHSLSAVPLFNLTNDNIDDPAQFDAIHWAGPIEAPVKTTELEPDDESIYELCREHLSSTESD
ncbi:SEC7-like protein [Basidiobolus meristosporus CBS 931.73]|uniref:SEC7-like protein n=1 Tax=Basidiobolus meristosporus CBS 931.73 TaxID=1314790 RepID=A0A1Y1YRH9_9FUNG|nr:SEC7-like protein [Basidiobolus meristosporus CBS 931.73]|eukprot:ORY00576.1 SEC7-like protein [Basidiobolus meristosporus CBS 931.73]